MIENIIENYNKDYGKKIQTFLHVICPIAPTSHLIDGNSWLENHTVDENSLLVGEAGGEEVIEAGRLARPRSAADVKAPRATGNTIL